jgi:hypothetical protein
MPFAGLGLHILLALFCAVHAVRSRQPMYWLMILFAFPLLGSLVYLFAVYLPNSRLERSARKGLCAAARALDPLREVREARAALEEAPTAQNQMRLAAALLEAGDAPGAVQVYGACLQGPFANDPEIRYGAASALVACERGAEALAHLRALQQERPSYRPEQVALLSGRALAAAGQADEARQVLEDAERRFDTYATKAELAIWAYQNGQQAVVERLAPELARIEKKWNTMSRDLNAEVARRLAAARAGRNSPG